MFTESFCSVLWVNQERTGYFSTESPLGGVKTTIREMPKQSGVEGREHWQEVGISLSLEKISPGK